MLFFAISLFHLLLILFLVPHQCMYLCQTLNQISHFISGWYSINLMQTHWVLLQCITSSEWYHLDPLRPVCQALMALMNSCKKTYIAVPITFPVGHSLDSHYFCCHKFVFWAFLFSKVEFEFPYTLILQNFFHFPTGCEVRFAVSEHCPYFIRFSESPIMFKTNHLDFAEFELTYSLRLVKNYLSYKLLVDIFLLFTWQCTAHVYHFCISEVVFSYSVFSSWLVEVYWNIKVFGIR